MYIDPGTDIYLFQGVPLDNSYDNTILFQGQTQQIDFFVNQSGYHPKHFTNQTYQRLERGYMRLRTPADSIAGYNYCAFKNTRYSSKWWFAFILGVEWINNEVAELHIEIDVLQTWLFETGLESCFVEREHSSTDAVGDNLLPENFELGEYVSDGVERTSINLRDMSIVIAVPYVLATDGHYADMYSNQFSGLKFHVYPATVSGAHLAGAKLADYSSNPDTVVSVFMCPSVLVNAASNPAASDADLIVPASQATIQKYSQTGSTNIYGFTFHNNKLLTYPYCALYVTNNMGGSNVFPYEYFQGSTCVFNLYAAMSTNPAAILVPALYKGATLNWDEALQLQGWPQCPWTYDTFRAYSAQVGVSFLGSAAQNMVYGAMAGAAGGPLGMIAGAAVGAGETLLGTVGSVVSAYTKSQIQPSKLGGTGSSAPLIAAGLLDFTVMHKRIRGEFAKMIDSYWDGFGYPVRLIKTPARNNRQWYTFTKTVGCTVRGAIPADVNKQICRIYDSGVRWWSPSASIIGDVAAMAPTNTVNP